MFDLDESKTRLRLDLVRSLANIGFGSLTPAHLLYEAKSRSHVRAAFAAGWSLLYSCRDLFGWSNRTIGYRTAAEFVKR
jgi:hypothetical protein